MHDQYYLFVWNVIGFVWNVIGMLPIRKSTSL